MKLGEVVNTRAASGTHIAPDLLRPRLAVGMGTHQSNRGISLAQIPSVGFRPLPQTPPVMLAMRDVGPEGFGKKNRGWNSTELLKDWREAWSAHVNERMAELGLEGRIDHRSYEAQGIELEPQHKIGPAASRRPEQGLGRADRGSRAHRPRQWLSLIHI